MYIIMWCKTENFYLENFHRFMWEENPQGEKLQKEQRMIHAHSYKLEKRCTYVPHPGKSNIHDVKKYTSE